MALAIVAGALVFVASGIVFFSLAFWLGKVETLARQLWELLITFSLYPGAAVRRRAAAVLFTLIPAGWVGYVPARVARRGVRRAPLLLLTAAAVVYVTLALTVFRIGLRRYASGSRFGTFG